MSDTWQTINICYYHWYCCGWCSLQITESSIDYRKNVKYYTLYAIILSTRNNNLLYLESQIPPFAADGKKRKRTELNNCPNLITLHAPRHKLKYISWILNTVLNTNIMPTLWMRKQIQGEVNTGVLITGGIPNQGWLFAALHLTF